MSDLVFIFSEWLMVYLTLMINPSRLLHICINHDFCQKQWTVSVSMTVEKRGGSGKRGNRASQTKNKQSFISENYLNLPKFG
jgi:hypothetical protein